MGFMTTGYFNKVFGNRYRALLSQAGTANPTAVVLQNGIQDVNGNASTAPVWTRTGVGTYQCVLTGGFPVGKTVGRAGLIDLPTGKWAQVIPIDVNTVQVKTGVVGGALADGLLNNTEVEITVFQ